MGQENFTCQSSNKLKEANIFYMSKENEILSLKLRFCAVNTTAANREARHVLKLQKNENFWH